MRENGKEMTAQSLGIGGGPRPTTVRQVLRNTTWKERIAATLAAGLMLAPLVPWQMVKTWVG